MKKALDQKDGYPDMCQTCGKKGNKKGNNYCSKLCQKKFIFMYFEGGKMKFSKTDEEIKKLLK